MSSQSKIIKDILSTYDSILENKKISEATDVYDNVDFKDNAVGNSTPSKDTINTSLLQDIQTAAQNARLKVDITTAVTGHDKGTRHETGNAVDIAIINGKAVSLANRADADKLVGELVKMGYTKNSESGNPKAVLTFGFKGHDNHVHISNNTGSVSSTSTSGGTSIASTSSIAPNQYNITRTVGQAALAGMGITEGKVYSSFGKDYIVRNGQVIIPKEDNKKIKSPVSGNITSYLYNSNCLNQLFIKFKVGDKTFYLEYCGLKSISVRKGDNVSQGEVIGMSDTDIRVTLYGSDGNIKYIDPKLESNEKNSGNEYDGKDLNNGLYTSAYRKVRDTWFKKDKVQENINRIKGLL
jgi:murein DD-endopeptidase MepM/ murein hydrolase activator NlpD